MFPSSELRAGAAAGDITKGVIWIDDPGPQSIVQVDLLLAKPSFGKFDIRSYPAVQQASLLDEFKLPNQERVLVVSRVLPETPQMVARLAAAKQQILARTGAQGIDLSSPSLRTLVVVERENGLMGIVDATISGR